MKWLRRRPTSAWRTNAGDTTWVAAIMNAAVTGANHGTPWFIVALLAGIGVTVIVDEVAA
jgi:hypothetical protein